MIWARVAVRWCRWVLTCLLLTVLAPAPAAAQAVDGIALVASARASAPPVCEQPVRRSVEGPQPTTDAAIVPAVRDSVGPRMAPPRRRATPLYLVNCALLR